MKKDSKKTVEDVLGFMSSEEIGRELNKICTEGATLADVRGITPGDLELVYSLGFRFYNSGQYESARKLFEFLVLFDHLNTKFWFALGGVLQMQKNYPRAAMCFSFASFLDLDKPKAQFHAAECYWASGDRENALSALSALEEFAPRDTEDGREYRKRGAALKARILRSRVSKDKSPKSAKGKGGSK